MIPEINLVYCDKCGRPLQDWEIDEEIPFWKRYICEGCIDEELILQQEMENDVDLIGAL